MSENGTVFRRIPLTGAKNARDLGGYNTEDGFITNWKKFIRSDSVGGFVESDIFLLKQYGLTTIIDLRSEIEIKREPVNREILSDVTYIHCPLFVEESIIQMPLQVIDFKEIYIMIAEKSKERIANVMKILAESDGVCLFNCTAGKDRTGIIAALLLSLVHVYHDDIVADYQVTYTFVRTVFAKIDAIASDVFQQIANSNMENIEAFLAHIANKYENTENYLKNAGVSDKAIDQLKEKFLSKITYSMNSKSNG